MIWKYEQATGKLFLNDTLVAANCFAGQPPWLNSADGWRVIGKGPLPCGRYTIGKASDHPVLGRITMNLTPDPANDMAGRSAFRIHGWRCDDKKDFSSQGCICADKATRLKIDASEDKDLVVVRGD